MVLRAWRREVELAKALVSSSKWVASRVPFLGARLRKHFRASSFLKILRAFLFPAEGSYRTKQKRRRHVWLTTLSRAEIRLEHAEDETGLPALRVALSVLINFVNYVTMVICVPSFNSHSSLVTRHLSLLRDCLDTTPFSHPGEYA
jgi:hypothetical protein